jgi:PiT family inorganic phosphate transporter
LIHLDRSGRLSRPAFDEAATRRDVLGAVVVLTVACYNAFSAGASSAANAVAPLVGSGSLSASQGVLLAIGAIGVGAFTIARRTLDTVGEGLTDLPILAAIVVSLIGATIITILSGLGIPASLAVSMTSCIIGLGWGRASRAVTIVEAAEAAVDGEGGPDLSAGALLAGRTSDGGPAHSATIGEVAAGETLAHGSTGTRATGTEPPHVRPIGGTDPGTIAEAPELFDRAATGRVVFFWLLTPTVSTIGSYAVFALLL